MSRTVYCTEGQYTVLRTVRHRAEHSAPYDISDDNLNRTNYRVNVILVFKTRLSRDLKTGRRYKVNFSKQSLGLCQGRAKY